MITLTSLALCLALGVAARAQEDEGPLLSELGPSSTAATDAQGFFFAEFTEPLPFGVSGQLVDLEGDALAGVGVTVVLEPRPGIPTILGIGNIGAVWLEVAGYDQVRIAGFTIVSRSRLVMDIGSVALSTPPACTPGAHEFKLRADEEGRVQFLSRRCRPNGTWGSWALYPRWATKYDTIPVHDKAKHPSCTWIVVTTTEAKKVIYTFYHSTGSAWEHRGSVEIAVVNALPATAEICTYYRVEQAGGRIVVHHRDAAKGGTWSKIGEWTTQPPPSDPPPEPDPDPWIPVP